VLEQGPSAIHLGDDAVQGLDRAGGNVGDDGPGEVPDPRERGKLDPLGVNEDKLEAVRLGVGDEVGEHGGDKHALPAPGLAGDDEVGELVDTGGDDLAGDVDADGEAERGVGGHLE